MDYEEDSGVLYWAAYSSGAGGELRILDMTTGNSALVGAFPGSAEVDSLAFATGGPVDVPWLSEDPASGTVPGFGDEDVDIVYDPSTLTQPGDYQAALKIKHETPYTYPDIPVTLHLLAPTSWGRFTGTVTSQGICDENPRILEGATVNIYTSTGTLVTTLSTDALGHYAWWLAAGTYDIEVLMADHVTLTAEDVVVSGGSTTTVDFALRMDAPCLSVDPDSLEQWLAPDTSDTQQLTINNTGAADAVFELKELLATNENSDVDMSIDDGVPENGIHLTSGGGFIWLNRFTPDADAFPFYLYEIQVLFGNTVSIGNQMQVVIYSDTDGDADPGTGAIYLGGETFGVVYNDDTTWNIFTLTNPIMVDGPGDVLVGLVNRTTGTDIYPASIDQTASEGRSWLGYYSAGDPPAQPSLPADSGWGLIDDFGFAGNWTLRGLGGTAEEDILWLSEAPISGTVLGDNTLDISTTFNSAGLTVADYFAILRLENPLQSAINIPVTLHVGTQPVANDQLVTTVMNTPINITLTGSDPGGGSLTYIIVTPPAHGTLTGTAPNLIYTPDSDWYGADSFTFRVNNGDLDSNIATVSITVNQITIYLPLIIKK
jgi:hypothetical protein